MWFDAVNNLNASNDILVNTYILYIQINVQFWEKSYQTIRNQQVEIRKIPSMLSDIRIQEYHDI